MKNLSVLFWILGCWIQTAAAGSVDLKGFHCNKPDSIKGTYCEGAHPSYPLAIGIQIPPGYVPGEQAEYTLFLHGHNYTPDGRFSTLAQILKRFSILEHVASTERKRIALFPHSRNKCDEFKSHLGQPARLHAFLEAMTQLIHQAGLISKPEIGSIALAGQSGAYAPLAMIIDQEQYQDRIHELYLLDAMYGNAASFTRFAMNPKNRFWSCYLPTSSTRTQNELVMKNLKQAGIEYFQKAGDLSIEAASRTRLGFIEANTTHGGAIKYLGAFMGNSP